jgi:hypothetical protein
MASGFGGIGQQPSGRGLITNTVALAPGETYQLPTGGAFGCKPGRYTSLQLFDPILQAWRTPGAGDVSATTDYVNQDGINWRLANQTGCAVGALITNAGSGYTSVPAVAASAGSSQWRAIIGGAVSTTVTVSNGGTGYTYAPIVLLSAPPQGGIQATATCTLSGGAVSTVTIIDQGAGYTSPPTVTFINDYRETLNAGPTAVTYGTGASAVCSLTGSQTLTGLICIDHGTSLTALPTLSFTGGGGSSAAATTIMCWSITGFTPTSGTGFTGPSLLSGLDAFPTTSPAYTNVTTQRNLVKTRLANILMPAGSGSIPASSGAVFYDGGIYTSVPTPLVTTNGALITATTTITFTMGGYTDVSEILVV